MFIYLIQPITKLWVPFVHVVRVTVATIQLHIINSPTFKCFCVFLDGQIDRWIDKKKDTYSEQVNEENKIKEREKERKRERERGKRDREVKGIERERE